MTAPDDLASDPMSPEKRPPFKPRGLVISPYLQTPEGREALAEAVRANQALGLPW